MYVCICQAITDRQIAKAARDGAQTIDDLKDQLGVSSCCGSCQDQAEAILAEHSKPAAVGRWRPALAG